MTARRKDVPVFGGTYEPVLKAAREGRTEEPAPAPGVDHALKLAIVKLYQSDELKDVPKLSEGAELRVDIDRSAKALAPRLLELRPGTELWYAAATVVYYADMSAARMRNDVEAAIEAAFDLGALVREAGIQKEYGGKIDFASEQVARVEKFVARQREQAEQRRANWQSEADRIWANNPSIKKSGAAEIIARKTGEKPDTIRKAIHKS